MRNPTQKKKKKKKKSRPNHTLLLLSPLFLVSLGFPPRTPKQGSDIFFFYPSYRFSPPPRPVSGYAGGTDVFEGADCWGKRKDDWRPGDGYGCRPGGDMTNAKGVGW